MKNKVFLILLLNSLVFLNCFSSFENPFAEKTDPKDSFIFFCYAGVGSVYEEIYEVQDRNDGTLEVVRHYDTTSCFGLLKNRETTSQYFIKKCIQGQVYREAENDCKGTGSADDYYGAQKYQFCPTNDTTCDGISDESNSPARETCLNDPTASKTWRTRSLFPDDKKYIAYYEYVKTRTDEIPSGESDYYWNGSISLHENLENSYAEAQLLIENSENADFLKNTYLYVVCINR